MKKNFKDRLATAAHVDKESWMESSTIPYDQRTSCYVAQGSHYGVGVTQPVGSEKHNPKYAVPIGRVNTIEDDERG